MHRELTTVPTTTVTTVGLPDAYTTNELVSCLAIGRAAILTARLYSPARIVAIDHADSRLEAARKFGADIVVNNSREDPGRCDVNCIELACVAKSAGGLVSMSNREYDLRWPTRLYEDDRQQLLSLCDEVAAGR